MTRWITIEGIEGAGKTYLAGIAARQLGSRCLLLSELTDQQHRSLAAGVITALSRAADLWLRTGHPVTETLALLALKAGEHEGAACDARGRDIVLEDRGIDSVAVYQALILAGPDAPDDRLVDVVDLIYATARHFRPPPDLTILLTDDPETCMARLERRTGQRLTPEGRAIIARAADLYARQAAREPGRFRIIRRAGRTSDESAADLLHACTAQPEGEPAHA